MLKIWIETDENAFEYFNWAKEKKSNLVFQQNSLSVFSINGSMLYGAERRLKFIDKCCDILRKTFLNTPLLNEFRFYLFVNVEVRDKDSHIEKYRKVWKSLSQRWQVNDFIKGPEIEIEKEDKTFYSSIAEIRLNDIETALAIVSSNPSLYMVMASKEGAPLSEQFIVELFTSAFAEQEDPNDGINFLNLSALLCPKGNIVFRWGDSAEEAEIALIFDKPLFSAFSMIGM